MQTPESYLSIVEPEFGSNRFSLVAGEKGITVYKQQVRALNLLYAMHETRRLKRNSEIAIIGAGVSGITATAAAFILGYRVTLFEKSSILCHLQHGCETRWIHPHLYDWPRHGSLRQNAGLPFLDWKASTASDVIEQIVKGYTTIIKRKPLNVRFVHRAQLSFKTPRRIDWKGSSRGQAEFDAVIFALGYGVERGVNRTSAISYWRNDSFNQVEPGIFAPKQMTYLISGTGDGGLIDLIRTKISGYNQGRLVEELFGGEAKLLNALRRIRDKWDSKGKSTNSQTWLYDQYNKLLADGSLAELQKRLSNRLRLDTRSILNGTSKDLAEALTLDRGSVLNTLIVFCLERSNALEYIGGTFSGVTNKVARISAKKIKTDHVIIRHGPDTVGVCDSVGFKEGRAIIAKIPDSELTFDTSERIWPAGWWGINSQKVLSGERVEYVSAATIAIANTFVSSLADVIRLQHLKKNPEFRIALHRTIRVNEDEYFQQVSRYAGTRGSGQIGRVFDIRSGIVGLACRLGKPTIVYRDKHFNGIWEELELLTSRARPIDPSVKSLFAYPFFAPYNPSIKNGRILLVLFIDSEQSNFFDDKIMKIVHGSCTGFVENVEMMSKNREIEIIRSDYPGHTAKRSSADAKVVRKYRNVIADGRKFRWFRKDLAFRTVLSFDMELNYNRYIDAPN